MSNKGMIRAAWAAVKAEIDALGVLLDLSERASDPHTEHVAALAIVERLPALVDRLAELEVQLDIFWTVKRRRNARRAGLRRACALES